MKTMKLLGGFSFIVAGFLFCICLIIFQSWMFNSPQWQARLYGIQTQGVVKSVADSCDATAPDPNVINNGGFVLGSLLPRAQIQQNVLPTIEFTDRQGRRHDVQEVYCGDYAVGEPVTVWYVSSNPATIALPQDTDPTIGDVYIPLGGMLLALPFIVGSLVILIVGTIRRRRAVREKPIYVN